MRRRHFFKLVGAAAVVGPVAGQIIRHRVIYRIHDEVYEYEPCHGDWHHCMALDNPKRVYHNGALIAIQNRW